MGYVRRFTRDDIPQVAQLHEQVFPPGCADSGDGEGYAAYFNGVFLENPAGNGALHSLVYQEYDGRILGFLGVVRRRVAIHDCRYEAAVSSQFVVARQAARALVATRLIKAYLDGPQDLSIADEATDVARRIWEGVGGSTALLHSLYWTRALRPARLALSLARQRRSLAPFAIVAGPIASALDALATRLPGGHFRQTEPAVEAEEFSPETVLAYAPGLYGDGTLWVEYEDRTFQWLLDRAATRRAGGRVLKIALRSRLNVVGWYVCYLDPTGHAEVVQLAATPSSIDDVLDHLFFHAWRHGAVAVHGRLDPRFIQALSDKYCFIHRRGPWLLVRARRAELLSAFQTGKAAFSLLDGEWSLRFQRSR
ncbi:MAG TPA: hypothetical protein VIX63_00610 [Vicinamibacterales bacterium]